MRLTLRGVAVSITAAVLLVAGGVGGYPLFTMLGAITLTALLAAVATSRGSLRLDVRRAVHPQRVERGRPALAQLRVRNAGRRRHPGFLATDTLGPATRTVRVRALLPGAEVTHHYELPTATRGVCTVGPLVLHRRDAFGLVDNRLATGGTATLRVHPRQLPARVTLGGYPRHHHEGTVPDRALRGSVELQDVREYVPGDETRHLHWKATARAGRLMVRDLADPRRGRLSVLLDDRAGALPAAAFEEAVDLTASLLCAAARGGQTARLVTASGRELTVGGAAEQLLDLLDLLCELGQDAPPEATLTPGGSGGALIVVTAGDADLDPVTRARRRFDPITVVVLTDADPQVPATLRQLRARDADQALRAWNETHG
ncbi:DUF58 domain-containing protein [Plantactinospora sp. WMMB782]|uniref:DUF58 domain-containing protein n=1 Tax=Plantactinospora sp. WMMB782 TaxID=3404121 RepID=UPI003B9614EF